MLDQALGFIVEQATSAVLLVSKDIQQAALLPSTQRDAFVTRRNAPQLPHVEIREAAGLLAAARCVVIAGDEVVRARAQPELAQLLAAVDAVVAVAPDARDAFDNADPRFVGVAGAMGHAAVVHALAAAELCVLVGTRLPLLARMGLEPRLRELPMLSIGRDGPFVQGAVHRHLACELRSGLRALGAAVRDARPERLVRVAPQPRAAEQETNFDSAGVLQRLGAAIADDSVVLIDAGNTGASAVHHLPAPRRGRWLIAMGMAGMGYTFGAAVGAAIASGRRCWAIAGDGAFYIHGLEIHTAVEHALPITYVIFDNRAHGMCAVRERLLLHEDGDYNEFRRSHLAAGLRAMFPGLYARECSSLEELQRALAELPADGPSVLSIELETLEVPPFVQFQRSQPGTTRIPRGGRYASE